MTINDIAAERMETDTDLPLYIKVCELDSGGKAIDIRLYTPARLLANAASGEVPTRKGIFLFLSKGKCIELSEKIKKLSEYL